MAAMNRILSRQDLAELNHARLGAWSVSAAEGLIERGTAVRQQLAARGRLSAWDHACIRELTDIIDRTRAELIRREIAAIMRLAGKNYAVKERDFWRRYHAQAKSAGS
jgi:hypothetical protein